MDLFWGTPFLYIFQGILPYLSHVQYYYPALFQSYPVRGGHMLIEGMKPFRMLVLCKTKPVSPWFYAHLLFRPRVLCLHTPNGKRSADWFRHSLTPPFPPSFPFLSSFLSRERLTFTTRFPTHYKVASTITPSTTTVTIIGATITISGTVQQWLTQQLK